MRCVTCDTPLTEENRSKGHRSKCKPCHNAYHRAYNASRPGYRDGISRKSRYGISDEEYREREARGCEICGAMGADDGTGRRLSVDHDHATGVVRGLLCGNCNRGLGLYFDDPARLRAAAEYLERA